MIYVVLFFMAFAAVSFAWSLGFYIGTTFAADSETYLRRKFAAVGHCGFGLIYLAIVAIILIVHALVTM